MAHLSRCGHKIAIGQCAAPLYRAHGLSYKARMSRISAMIIRIIGPAI